MEARDGKETQASVHKLVMEKYLLSEKKKGRYLLTSIRTGTNKLTGRWKRLRRDLFNEVLIACEMDLDAVSLAKQWEVLMGEEKKVEVCEALKKYVQKAMRLRTPTD